MFQIFSNQGINYSANENNEKPSDRKRLPRYWKETYMLRLPITIEMKNCQAGCLVYTQKLLHLPKKKQIFFLIGMIGIIFLALCVVKMKTKKYIFLSNFIHNKYLDR